MLKNTYTRLKKFNEENPRFVGYLTGVSVMTAFCLWIDNVETKWQEENGFKTVRLFKDTDTDEILAYDPSGNRFKLRFPEETD